MFDDPKPPATLVPPMSTERTWGEIWRTAISQPSLETYRDLLNTSDITLGRGLLWMGIAQGIANVVQLLVISIIQFIIIQDFLVVSSGFVSGLAGIPLQAGFSLGSWLFFLGCIHLIARQFGGKGTYEQMAFLSAAFQAPLTIINTILFALVLIGWIFIIPMIFYQMFLGVIAVNAVHEIGWGKSLIAYFALPLLFLMCILACIFTIVASLSAGDLNSLQNMLVTPTP